MEKFVEVVPYNSTWSKQFESEAAIFYLFISRL